MSGSFIAVALVVVVLLVFWRLTLFVAAALLITVLITGATVVTDAFRAAEQAATSITNSSDTQAPPVRADAPH